MTTPIQRIAILHEYPWGPRPTLELRSSDQDDTRRLLAMAHRIAARVEDAGEGARWTVRVQTHSAREVRVVIEPLTSAETEWGLSLLRELADLGEPDGGRMASVELCPVRGDEDGVEVCSPGEAQRWAIYVRRWSGRDCLASHVVDLGSRAEGEEAARSLAGILGVPLDLRWCR